MEPARGRRGHLRCQCTAIWLLVDLQNTIVSRYFSQAQTHLLGGKGVSPLQIVTFSGVVSVILLTVIICI
jgi:hypothetical protein